MNKIVSSIICSLIGSSAFLFPSIIKASVLINEFSPASNNDWVEIYTDETIDVSGWTVESGSSVIYTFTQGTVLSTDVPYVVIDLQNAFTESGELRLVNDKGGIADILKYGYTNSVCSPSASGSIGRYASAPNVKDRFSIPSKGTSNASSVPDPCPSPTPSQTQTPTPTALVSIVSSNTPTNTPTKSVTITETPSQSPTPNESKPEVLAQHTSEITLTPTITKKSRGDIPSIAFILIGLGTFVLSIVLAIFLVRKKQYTK